MEKILESGAILKLSLCSFAEGSKLMKAVARELRNTTISLGVKEVKNLGDLFKIDVGDEALNTFKNLVAGLISSEEIEAALWPCIVRGSYIYAGVETHINKDLFEDEKARADYLPILKEALVYNLSPFFVNLKSLVLGSQGASTASPR
jgi:hypothetical protein